MTGGRSLHPGAWWAWALALGAVATRTTNPLLLGLLIAVAGFVVAARSSREGRRQFGFFLRLGVLVFVLRLAFEIAFGTALPGTVLVRLPSVALPHFLAGLRIGGPITMQALLTAAYGGLQLAALLICIGAANALASPRRLLKSLPGALYEVGVAVTVALSFAPQLVHATARVRKARRLRGLASSGLRGWVGVAMPVLQDGLERAVDLAAAMDARGFGRRGAVCPARRRVTTAAVLVGLLAVTCAVYGVLDVGAPALIGVPLLVSGSIVASGAIMLGGHNAVRSKYRPDPWRATEWLAVAAGAFTLGGVLLAGRWYPGSLATTTYPIAAPQLPWPAALGLLLALGPAAVASRRAIGVVPAEPARPAELIGAAR
jgi:energy-coupling factor transport system permease protein